MKKLNNSTLKAKKQTRETIISFRSNVFKFCLKIKTFVLMLEKDFLFKLQELLLRIDIEKAFDSAKHNFLLKVLESYGSILWSRKLWLYGSRSLKVDKYFVSKLGIVR